MAEFLSPGIKVVEIRSGVADVQGVSTSTGGFLGAAEKGPVNEATLITSLTQFQEVFGQPQSASYLYEQVDAFFKNGGSRCYVVRVAHYTSIADAATITAVKATATLQTDSGGATSAALVSTESAPFNLEPGYTVIVDVDNAGPATATFDAAAATAVGSAATYAAMNGKTILFEVDNDGDTQTVTFTAGATDAATSAAEFNAAARGCRMVVNTGQVNIRSDKRGTASEIDIKSGTGVTALGHAVGVSTGTGDVADINAVTNAEAKAVFESDVAGLTYTPATGVGPATLTSDTTGVASEIDITGGTGAALFGFAGTENGTAAAAPANTVKIDASSHGAWGNNLAYTTTKDDVIVGRLATTLSAGSPTTATLTSTTQLRVGDYVQITDTSNANTIRVLITAINGSAITFAAATVAVGGITAATSTVKRERFTIKVSYKGVVVETYSELAMSSTQQRDYYVSRINNTSNASITVTDQASVLADARPAAASNVYLASGTDGSAIVDADYVGNSASALGLYALDIIDGVNMLSVPGVATTTVQRGLLDYCEARGDVFAILSTPSDLTPAAALAYVTTTANLVSSYGAIYYPWVKSIDLLTGLEELSPVDGFAQGIYARTDRSRNVSKAPAGTVDGRVRGITGVERDVSEGEYDTLYPSNINCVLSIPGTGVALMGSRTLETGEFRQIPVRRLFMYIEESLGEASRFVSFEDNDADTRGKVTKVYRSFLRGLRLAGMLKGSSDSEAFFVICDDRNNTASSVNTGLLRARVGVAVKKPVEFLQIEVLQDTRALDAELAA